MFTAFLILLHIHLRSDRAHNSKCSEGSVKKERGERKKLSAEHRKLVLLYFNKVHTFKNRRMCVCYEGTFNSSFSLFILLSRWQQQY